MSAFAAELLKRQLLDLQRNPPQGISVGLKDDNNLFEWSVLVDGPAESPYEGGLFKAELIFPSDFPNHPPDMKFISEMWHPNIFDNGKVCISILHQPGIDEFNPEESAEERWRPILSVEAILVSVQNMLGAPNDSSPANIDAAVQWRKDKVAFKRKVRKTVEKSLEMC
ncbi:hypothetical protein WA158_001929 [Blastocystis sp. Blastoise]